MFWVARLFTGLLLAAGGCSALIGVHALARGAMAKAWMGVGLLAAGIGSIVAAFMLDGMAVRAIRRRNAVPEGRGFDVLPPGHNQNPGA
jgi:hypothetical protein